MNWYSTRERVKRATGTTGSSFDQTIDDAIESASRAFDRATHTRFIPLTATYNFDARWPRVVSDRLRFDNWLWSVSALTDQGDEAAAVASSEYRLLPENEGPPYFALQLLGDVTNAALESDPDTYMQSFRLTGDWSKYVATQAAGSLAAAISDAAATTIDVKNGALVGVGDTLLLESERLFVSDRAETDLAVNSVGALTLSKSDQTLTLGDPADDLNVNEIIRIGSERMRVIAVNSATSVEVERAIDGTVLAAHDGASDIYVSRRLTVTRGVNGTTAATHANDKAIAVYAVPGDVRMAVEAKAATDFAQQRASWGREIVRGEHAREFTGRAAAELWKRAVRSHRLNTLASAHGVA